MLQAIKQPATPNANTNSAISRMVKFRSTQTDSLSADATRTDGFGSRKNQITAVLKTVLMA
jgi:hypothetical protein